ncbi:hypothetical protein NFJ02_11g06460 [Pycnococcus provasolii]
MAETQTQRATLAKPMFDYELSADVSQAYREAYYSRIPGLRRAGAEGKYYVEDSSPTDIGSVSVSETAEPVPPRGCLITRKWSKSSPRVSPTPS